MSARAGGCHKYPAATNLAPGSMMRNKRRLRMGDAGAIIAAFSEEQAARLTGVSISQLRYWDRTNFYQPMFAADNRRAPFSRVYSFLDVAALRVLNVLRNQYDVPLQHLREVSEKLGQLGDERKWTGVRLYALRKRVIWIDPDSELPQEIVSQQYVVPTMLLATVIEDAKRDIEKLNVRVQASLGKIERSRFISHNAPVVAGTRITVAAIQRFYKAGYTTSQILSEYPDLAEADIEAAIAYKPGQAAA